MTLNAWLITLTTLYAFSIQPAFAQLQTTSKPPIEIIPDEKITYHSLDNGDRVPDFSYCGYMLSETPIPDVPVKAIVSKMKGDATATIQKAIDYVSSIPPNKQGFRGAVLLQPGTYEVSGTLSITTSGVVLRGSGSGVVGTTIIGTGFGRETLIKIAGKNDRQVDKFTSLADAYYPVNTTRLSLKGDHSFKVGDRIIINRPSTKDWIETIGTDKIGLHVDYQLTHWEPGDFDQNWYRTITAVHPQSITIDVPLSNSLDPKYGGGKVAKYTWPGQINNAGVENIRCISSYDQSNPKDENHRWMAVTIESATDSWVRRVVAEHFVSSAVAVWETASRITVEDCKSLAPVREIRNHRRYSFHTLGQQVLFQRCYAEYGYHDFSVGFTTPGPNAFVQCYSYLPYNFSGTLGGWSTGVLFDKLTIDGGVLRFANREVDGQGGGWSTANSMSWQTRAAQVHIESPPTAQNWAYGSWAQGYGNGYYGLARTFIKPESLFYAQLEARTGKKSAELEKILTYQSDRTTAPSPKLSETYSERSKHPDLIMKEWIDSMIVKYPIRSEARGAKAIKAVQTPGKQEQAKKGTLIAIENGWLSIDGKPITGRKARTSMWRGSTRRSDLDKASANLVRFVPGRTGRGLTDNLDSVAANMLSNNIVTMQHFPALWYERRRDDHARTRRADADVWAPFYEQPFSRSGQGEAFDRLSKYDLTKWNTWYWLRLKRFANLADENGLTFIQEHYLQHNIIEEGAHWADYPWRTANNINNTGFAENPAYAGDKRVYMAAEFYDTTHVVRKALHRNYIRKSLDNFKDNKNIIHHLGMEYTGPLHFVQFWLDVIAEWEKENHQDVIVMLPGTRDVQDAILADKRRSAVVDGIDVIQWQYRKDGSLYSPIGGQSLAPRQYARILDVGETSFEQIHRAVAEFRRKYPEKAITYSRGGGKFAEWAVFLGGGSLTSLPPIKDRQFLEHALKMKPMVLGSNPPQQYVLGQKGTGYIIFNEERSLSLNLGDDHGTYTLKWINPSSGEVISSKQKVKGGRTASVQSPLEGAAVAWLIAD